MASDGGGAIGSTFFEVRLEDIPPEEPKPEKQKGTGGMSFNVDLDETNEEEKNLQLAARLHRIKSEMRRSNIAAQKEAEKIERERVKIESELKTDEEKLMKTDGELSVDDLKDSNSSNDSPQSKTQSNGTPSEAGTYTLRLDSAEVRERKNLVNITQDSFQDQNSATESTEATQETAKTTKDFDIGPPQDFEIPSAVSARITEWFNRNEMAESRNSETSNGTDSNLEDIREKAKNRLKQKKDELTEKASCDTLDDISSAGQIVQPVSTSPSTNQKSTQKESKIILSREDRTQKKAENVRSKGSNPQVRLTRAMLLRKNRALGIKPGEELKEPAPEVPKPAAKPARQISARLDNLSKPKRKSEIGLQNNAARQRSFSHEDAKVYRGRSVAKPQESAKGPTRKETSSRSNSLSRAGSKPNITVAKRTKQDVLSQSVRTETKNSVPKAQKSQRSTSLTRSTTSTAASLKVKQIRKSSAALNQSWAGGQPANRITSSSSSSRTSRPTSRPATATSVRESHENSILYSLHIISNNCLTKTKEILQDMIGDLSEINGEIERLNSSGDDGQDLEAIFGRICALDKCLGKIRSTQVKSVIQKTEKNATDEVPQISEKPKTATAVYTVAPESVTPVVETGGEILDEPVQTGPEDEIEPSALSQSESEINL